MFKKIIYQGKLVFNRNSYDKVIKLYEYRIENFYRGDVLLPLEEVFVEEELSLIIGRRVLQATEKSWRNTRLLIEYCAQFAITGQVGMWLIDEKGLKSYVNIYPQSDKAVVQQYLKSLDLMNADGKEEEAIAELNKVIQRYDKHAMAYEKRGYTNMKLQRWHDAKRDFTKSIDLDPTFPDAYYGKAQILRHEGDLEGAIANYLSTTKNALALQPIHWKARRNKSKCLILLKEFDKAAFDLKFLVKREFKEDNPNARFRRYDYYLYASVLHELGEHKEALKHIEQALAYPEDRGQVSESDILYLRGVVVKAMGKRGFLKDLEASAAMGHKKAKKALAEAS